MKAGPDHSDASNHQDEQHSTCGITAANGSHQISRSGGQLQERLRNTIKRLWLTTRGDCEVEMVHDSEGGPREVYARVTQTCHWFRNDASRTYSVSQGVQNRTVNCSESVTTEPLDCWNANPAYCRQRWSQVRSRLDLADPLQCDREALRPWLIWNRLRDVSFRPVGDSEVSVRQRTAARWQWYRPSGGASYPTRNRRPLIGYIVDIPVMDYAISADCQRIGG